MKLRFKSLCKMAILATITILITMNSGRCDGFTTDTELNLSLTEHQIDRFAWELAHFNHLMPGTVELSSGHGTEASNKVMLYGDRSNPLLEGEPDWSMDPYPTNYYITSTETSFSFDFPFGPSYCPPDTEEWSQVYIYSACVNLENGDSTLAGDYVLVTDGLGAGPPGGTLSMSASTQMASTTVVSEPAAMTTTSVTSSLTALQSADTTVRVEATLALANSNDSRVEQPLLAALTDRQADVRWAAAYALGKQRNAHAVPALLQLLSTDPDADVRASSATALGVMNTEASVLPALINASHDSSPFVRQAVLRALARTSEPQAIATLIAAVDDPSLASRLTAIATIGRKRVYSADEALITVLQTRGVEERREAALALGSLGTPSSIGALIAALQDPDITVQKAAALSLGVLKDPHITTDIRTLYKDYYSTIQKK